MRKLLLSLTLLLIALLSPPSSHAQFVVVNQACGAGGLSTIANDGTPVVCRGNPLVWTAVGGTSLLANNPLPAATSGPGPVFNVKNYGAKGDAKQSVNGNGAAPGATCTDCNFTAADVGKTISCSSLGTTIIGNAHTIASVVSSTSVTINPSSREGNGPCTIDWGTPDDAAISSARVAAEAFASNANLITLTSAPVVYLPAGRYLITAGIQTGAFNMVFAGDGEYQSKLLYTTGTTATNSLFHVFNSTAYMHDLVFDGQDGLFTSGNGVAVGFGSNAVVNRVIVQHFNNVIGMLAGSSFIGTNISIQSNGNIGFECSGCSGNIHAFNSGNNNQNLLITNSGGIGASEGFKIFGGLVDECGNAAGCIQVTNSQDVWFIGLSAFGAPQCAGITGNSYVHWDGGICGPFGQDTNSRGIQIAAGSVLQATDVRFASSGTGNCITNSGTLNDNGGNSCESMFQITSGTSTGTTAVLTLVNAGAAVNTNCSVGDALMVQNAGIAGYNGYYPAGATSGITAVTATTLTYTTSGSNLGVLGAGGFALCRNLQTYTGNLPRALLNNPIPNTCYVTGTFAATVTGAPMCNFFLGQATNITRIKAASTTVTACTVAPVVTISDGTVSQTLTITTAKSQWDSSVDASSGVGTTIFKPNGTIQVTNTAGTCTTPPTNFSVSYNISPILSN